MRIAVLALVSMLAACADAAPALPPGYAIVPDSFEPNRQPDGNSVIIDAPGGLIVIDTGRHAAHQEAILDRARAAGRPIAAIVNTHWHLDHSGGNAELLAAFPEAEVITSRGIEGALTGFLADSRRAADAHIASGRASAAEIAENASDFAAIDAPGALLPTVPIEASGARAIAGRRFEIHLAPHAVTEGDVWLRDPATEMVITGDLVTAYAPFLDTACLDGWRAALDAIAATDWDTLIPGHGAPMDRAGFTRWRAAFDALVSCAASDAPEGRCAVVWRERAGEFLGEIAPALIDALIAHYVRARLRAPREERLRYCPPEGA